MSLPTISLLLAGSEPESFGADAAGYWSIAASVDHPLALLEYADRIRGFSIPMFFRLWASLIEPLVGDSLGADAATSVRLLMALLASTLTCVIAPAIAQRICPTVRVSVPRLLLLTGFFFLSWRDDLVQPLSDLPALFALACVVFLVIREPGSSGARSALVGGLLLGVIVNARPAYYVAAAAVFGSMLMLTRRWQTATLCVAGIVVVLTPQLMINVGHYDAFTVQPVDAGNMKSFLMRGLRLERYDSWSGVGERRRWGLRYVNRHFEDGLGGKREFDSIAEYLDVLANSPVAASAVYARHLVNGLDTRFGGTYVHNAEQAHPLLILVNFLAISCGAVVVGLRWAAGRPPTGSRRRTVWRRPAPCFVLVLLATLVPSILGAIEVRFLIALHLTALSAGVLGARREDLPSSVRGRLVAAALALGSTAAMFAVAESTIAKLDNGPPLVDAPKPAGTAGTSGTSPRD